MSTRWSKHSLHGRLLRRLLLVMTLVIAVGAVIAYGVARHFADSVFDAWLADSAESLAEAVHGDEHVIDQGLPPSIIQLVRFDKMDAVAFMVTESGGRVLAGRGDLPPPPLGTLASNGAWIYDGELDGHAVRIAYVTTPRAMGLPIAIAVAETLRKRRLLASELLIAALIPPLLLVGIAPALIATGVNRALAPLDAISAGLAQQDPLSLSPLPAGPPEVQPLVDGLNQVLAGLNVALDAQRHFVAVTAHQLRNPLAGLKLTVEDAMRQDTPLTRETLTSLLSGIERASRLAVQLLALARAEADTHQAQSPLQAVNLEQLAVERGREWAPRLLSQNRQIQLVTPPHAVMAMARPLLLIDAVDNLLDNALRYSGSGSTVQLIIERHGDLACLTVADNGPGFPENLSTTLFQRFARGDHSSGDGAGLGLAIVRELLHAQHGDAQALTRPGERGAAIRLSLRIA